MSESKPVSPTIIHQQKQVRESLPFDDRTDYVNAEKGFVGRLKPNVVTNASGVTVWDNDSYNFLKAKCPDTANPSLWRQSQLVHMDGLYRVVDGIYQVRGGDLSNTTFIEGDTGLIVIDPLTSAEVGAAALALYREHRGANRQIEAIIYTHSHVDHFGGVKGMISEEDVKNNGIKIFAPEGFLEHAVSENVFAGTAMSRRAAYMYGAALLRGAQGQIGAGLGQTTSTGAITLIAPNVDIKHTGEEKLVDGVKMVFQMAPDTEAPAEMLMYFPQFKALCAAEDATHTFHNILTLRGAVVRDPHNWAKHLNETIDLWGGKAEVVFASHHWPTWGSEEVVEFLSSQRDLYAYVHDQTLRLLNQGYTGPEIAEMMTLPPALDRTWSARGYYGAVSHNVKAIYQRYLGWFDGNPAHLWEHVPTERARRYAELAGGVGNLVAKGREALDAGDLRWAAEVLNHAVFAEPDNSEAKNALADTYEQLGYGAECGPWRNFFISGATELRCGNFGTPLATASGNMISQLTPQMLFDSLAVRVNGPKAWDEKMCIKIILVDTSVTYHLWLSNGALIYTAAEKRMKTDVTIVGTTRALPAIAIYGSDAAKLNEAGLEIRGDSGALGRFAALLDRGDRKFNIVTP